MSSQFEPIACEAPQAWHQAMGAVQFDPVVLDAAGQEMAAQRPDIFSACPCEGAELTAALAHALTLAAAIMVSCESVDPAAVVDESGLFDPQDDPALTRIKAVALDCAMAQAQECAPQLRSRLADCQKTLRALALRQPGCEDPALWTFPGKSQ